MFCQNCGTQLREDARFCHVCGAEQTLEAYHDTAVSPSPLQENIPAQTGSEGYIFVEPEPAVQEAEPAAQQESPVAQSLTGTFTWENVKISGEFNNGKGSITITFN